MEANNSNIDSILSVKDVSVVLGGKTIIHDIDFEVARGESLAIIGPNGSGKTVLYRALIGALPYGGEIAWAQGAKIGYVPQRLDLERGLPLTLKDFLSAKVKISGAKSSAVAKALELVHLPAEFLNKKLSTLSAGQLQRALIAFAMIGDPNVLLFDEPTSGVDVPREEQIYDTLHRLQAERDLTLLIISHDLSLVYRYATNVLCLNQKMVCFGTPHHVLTTENLKHLYGERVIYHHHHGDDVMHEEKHHSK